MNELQERTLSQDAQDSIIGPKDRRREPRTRMARPVYVRPAVLSDSLFEEVRTMINFSRHGLYFITPRIESYRNGLQLYVIPAFGGFNFEYLGEVVRIEQLPFGECGVAVQLNRIGNPVLSHPTIARSAFHSF
jgi:hypothetical protein